MYVDGGDWGIAGNTIHYLDLFYYLTEKNINHFNIIGLEKKIFSSKREGPGFFLTFYLHIVLFVFLFCCGFGGSSHPW